MNNKFSILTLMALIAVGGGQLTGTNVGAQAITEETAPNRDPNGNDLLRDSARRTYAHASVEARLRLRTMLLGQPLLGSGEYAQLNSSSGLLLRMEVAIQAGETTTSVSQISDGQELLEHWRLGKDKEHFHRIDLSYVQRVLRTAPPAAGLGTTSSLATGGIPKLLSKLGENFDFSRSELRQTKIGPHTVWVANGVWKLDKLATVVPDAIDGKQVVMDRLPAHIPHQVEVMLGQQDLFPYKVTYHQWRGREGEQMQLRPAVTIEFFDVAMDEALDPAQFDYKTPTNVAVVDRTDQYLQSLGVAGLPKATTTR